MSTQRSWVEHRYSLPIAKRAVLDCAMLESRTLFSASPLGLVLDSAAQVDGEATAGTSDAWHQTSNDLTDTSSLDSDDHRPPLELVFVDDDVEDSLRLIDDLLNDASPDRELLVFQLDGTRDGIQQINDVLANLADVQAIHLMSHGVEGQIRLGNLWLHSDNLADYAAEFANWNDALRDGADLLIYGCHVAANTAGQESRPRVSQPSCGAPGRLTWR